MSRKIRKLVYEGKEMLLADIISAAGSTVLPETLWNRVVRSGWPIKRALLMPSVRPAIPARRTDGVRPLHTGDRANG